MWTIKYEEVNLVSRRRGTLPVILSCPHAGSRQPDDVPEERDESNPNPECRPVKKLSDLHTREITTRVAQRLLDIFGEAPYVVIAEFHRRYIDANREAECAYDVPAARQYYDEYHNTLRNFVDEIRAETGGVGLFFDIHGTLVIEEDPADLYLGTDNKNSIARLLQFDPQALWRRRSLRGFLGPEAAGYEISPKQPDQAENKEVDGGHTVRTYGSSTPNGIDAIQLEIAAPIRNDNDLRAAFIENLAYAIGNFAARYVTQSMPMGSRPFIPNSCGVQEG
jgi:N-formylglutamate amidohydrolase